MAIVDVSLIRNEIKAYSSRTQGIKKAFKAVFEELVAFDLFAREAGYEVDWEQMRELLDDSH